MIITLDGPAASGKGTIARRISEHFDLPHLDTGLLYRGVAVLLLERGHSLDDAKAAEAAARTLDIAALDAERLRQRSMGEAASRVGALPEVRAALLRLQKDFARQPRGAVLDGRDTGTVIAPEADVKIFVTATTERRAERRFRELSAKGQETTFETVLNAIRERDRRDSERSVAPLKPASDAVLLDTTELDIEAAFRAALSIVEVARAGRGRG